MPNQPPIDRSAAIGRAEGRVARDVARHRADAAHLLFRIVALPVRLPIHLIGALKQRRDMVRFLSERLGGRAADDDTIHDIALAWVARLPDQYPHGQYDRRFAKLERRFARLARRYGEKAR